MPDNVDIDELKNSEEFTNFVRNNNNSLLWSAGDVVLDYWRTNLRQTIAQEDANQFNTWLTGGSRDLIYLALTNEGVQLTTKVADLQSKQFVELQNQILKVLPTLLKKKGFFITDDLKLKSAKFLFQEDYDSISQKYYTLKSSKTTTSPSLKTLLLLKQANKTSPEKRTKLFIDYFKNPLNKHRDLYKILKDDQAFMKVYQESKSQPTLLGKFFSGSKKAAAQTQVKPQPEGFGPQAWQSKKPGNE